MMSEGINVALAVATQAKTIDFPTNRKLERNGLYFQFQKKSTGVHWNLHSHSGYEIFFFQQGKASFLVGDRVYPLTVGDMILIPGDLLHIARPDLRQLYVRSVVNFLPSYLTQIPDEMMTAFLSLFTGDSGLLIHWDANEKCEIEKLLNRMQLETHGNSFGYEMMVHNYFTQLLVKIYRKVNSQNFKSAEARLTQRELHVEKILAAINERFRETIKLDDLARCVNLNKHYICHCFKEVTGFTVSQYIANRRLDEAKRLLRTTNTSVGCIASMVGIDNIAQFSRLFKQHAGLSPLAYRRQCMEEGNRIF